MGQSEIIGLCIVILLLILLLSWSCMEPDHHPRRVVYVVEGASQPNLAQKWKLDTTLGGIPVNALSISEPRNAPGSIMIPNSMTSLRKLQDDSDNVTMDDPAKNRLQEGFPDMSSMHMHRSFLKNSNFKAVPTGGTVNRRLQIDSNPRNGF